MRIAILVMALSLLSVGGAAAADFVVVRSSDPAITKSATFDGGDRVLLAPGAALTLITSAGQVFTFLGQAGGVTLPKIEASEPSRMALLQALISRPAKRRTFGGLRSAPPGCSPAASLTTIDDILMAEDAGCASVAAEALELYLSKSEAAPAPTPSPVSPP